MDLILVRLVDILGLQALEGAHGDDADQRVQLVSAVLVLVASAGESDSNSEGHISDALRPDELVEAGLNADVIRAHLLLGELLDLLDCPRSALLEADAVEALVQVDGVLAGDHLAQRRLALLVATRLMVDHGWELKDGEIEVDLSFVSDTICKYQNVNKISFGGGAVKVVVDATPVLLENPRHSQSILCVQKK